MTSLLHDRTGNCNFTSSSPLWHPRRRHDRDPRGTRGGAATRPRTIHVAPAAVLRPVRGRSTRHPRPCRDPSTIHVAPAAVRRQRPRFGSQTHKLQTHLEPSRMGMPACSDRSSALPSGNIE